MLGHQALPWPDTEAPRSAQETLQGCALSGAGLTKQAELSAGL